MSSNYPPDNIANRTITNTKLPCEQLMTNSLSTTGLRESSREQNLAISKVLWNVYLNRTNRRNVSLCNELQVEVVVSWGAGIRRYVENISSDWNSKWLRINVTASFKNSSQMPEKIIIKSTLRCLKCFEGVSIPFELIDWRLYSGERKEAMYFQPLLAVHFHNEDLVPFLQPLTKERRATREKRFPLFHLQRCGRKPLKVKSRDIYPNREIIHPPDINIGYCGGQCSLNLMLQHWNSMITTEHVMSKMKLGKKDEYRFLRISCVPITYYLVHIYERVGATIKSKFVSTLSVKECGCR